MATWLALTGHGLGNPIGVVGWRSSPLLRTGPDRPSRGLRRFDITASCDFRSSSVRPRRGNARFWRVGHRSNDADGRADRLLGNRALTGAAAAGCCGGSRRLLCRRAGEIVASSAAAALVAEVLDAFLASITLALWRKATLRGACAELLPGDHRVGSDLQPGCCVLVLAYRDVSPWTLPLFFAPALAAQRWFLMYQEQKTLGSLHCKVQTSRLTAANLSFAKGLIATLDARDRYTAGHSAAVAIYARDIAKRMDLDEAAASPRVPMRAGARHRKDRTPSGSAGEARRADPR